MRKRSWIAVQIASFVLAGCTVTPAPNSGSNLPKVEVEPKFDAVPERVLRISVTSKGALPSASELWLFSGELSAYYLNRIQRESLPDTLSARMLPASTWFEPKQRRVSLQPSVVLEPGALYTLAAGGIGELESFTVSADSVTPLFERVWPPVGEASAGNELLCGDGAPSSEGELVLEPAGVSAALEANFGVSSDGRSCILLSFASEGLEGSSLCLPTSTAGLLLDPAPLVVAASTPFPDASCGAAELALGPLCALVEDDRLVLRGAEQSLLLRISWGDAPRVVGIPANASVSLRGLTPDSTQELAGDVIGQGGARFTFDVEIRTQPPRPHLVLNEVLANPLGPEPAAEWVEIVNDGLAPANLDGVSFSDGSGASALPAVTLEPSEFALLVRSDYNGASDVPPLPGTRLIALGALGKSGLSNSGEVLSLIGVDGAPLSRFPALPSPHAGVSLARARLDASDDDASAFAEHAAPGASPGGPNTLVSAQ